MTLMLENENAMKDSLHCCSQDVTREHPLHQRYGRGIIMGMRSFGMALGYFLSVIDAIIRNHLPKDVDPACLPDNFPGVYLRKGRFKVNEHFNGFSLEDTKTGQTHWLSDGVDCVATSDDGEYMSPGEPGFTECWEDDFNGNESETMEAYFPDQLKLEEEGKVKCILCGCILDEVDAEYHGNESGKPEPYCPKCSADPDLDPKDPLDTLTLAKICRLDRAGCVKLLEGVGIQCYDHETEEVLREAVRVNVEDGTIPKEALDE